MVDAAASPAATPLLLYSQWPLGFYNPEGERKARALSEAGYDVSYVPGLGMRNPRLSRVGKAARVGLRKLRGARPAPGVGPGAGLTTTPLLIAPPRQLAAVARFNRRWLERQLLGIVPRWDDALAWLRYPTPELVEAVRRVGPRAVVYECVDAYDHTPGIVGAWEGRLESAEAALVELADVVVASSEELADRFRAKGAADVRTIPHGVEIDLFTVVAPDGPPERPVLGFVGTLDDRLDVPAIRHIASERPHWCIRLIGPARDNFDPGAVADLPNVTVEPPVPQEEIGRVIGQLDVGLMIYADVPTLRYMRPVKNLEYMAAGKPAVARPNRELAPYEDILYFAETPAEFLAQAERALGEDSPDRARERRRRAESETWQERLSEIVAVARELAPVVPERPPG